MRRSYNYRNIFKKPIVIHRLERWTLPTPLQLNRLLIGIPLAVVFWIVKTLLLDTVFGALSEHLAVTFLYYGAGLYYTSNFLTQEHDFFDAKNIFVFIKDYWRYYFTIRSKQKKFSNDQEVKGLEEATKFKKTVL